MESSTSQGPFTNPLEDIATVYQHANSTIAAIEELLASRLEAPTEPEVDQVDAEGAAEPERSSAPAVMRSGDARKALLLAKAPSLQRAPLLLPQVSMRGDRDRAARPSGDGTGLGSPSTPKLPPLLELAPDGYSSGGGGSGGGTPRKSPLAGPMAALARGNSLPRRISQPGANGNSASGAANNNSGAASPLPQHPQLTLPGSPSGRLQVPLDMLLPRRSDDGLLSGSGAASPAGGGLGSGPQGIGGRRPRLSHTSSSRAFEGFGGVMLGVTAGLGGSEAAQGLAGSASVPVPGVLAAGVTSVGLQAAAGGLGSGGGGAGSSSGGAGPALSAVASFRSRRLSSFAGDRPSGPGSGSGSPATQAAGVLGAASHSSRLLFSGHQLLPSPPPSGPAPSATGAPPPPIQINTNGNINFNHDRPAQLSSPVSPHTSLISSHMVGLGSGLGSNSPIPGSPLSALASTETGATTPPGGGGGGSSSRGPVPPPWAGGGAAAGLAARSSKRLLLAAALSSPVLTSSGLAGGGGSAGSTASGGVMAAAAAAAPGRLAVSVGGVSPLPRSSYDQIPSPFGTASGSAAAASASASAAGAYLGQAAVGGEAASEPGCVRPRAAPRPECGGGVDGDDEAEAALPTRDSGPARASFSGMPSFQFRTSDSLALDDGGGASGSANGSWPAVRSSSRRLTATHDSASLSEAQLASVGSSGAVGPATWMPMGLPSPSPPGSVAAGGSQKQLIRRMGSQRRSGLVTQASLSATTSGAAGERGGLV